MDTLVFLETAIVLLAPALHFVTDRKDHLVVYPMDALDITVKCVTVLAFRKLKHLAN